MSTGQTRISATVGCDGQPILSLTLTTHSDVPVIAVNGEVDFSTAHLLVDLVAGAVAHHPGCVVVDMAGVTFFCAAGINALLQAGDAVSATGGRLTVRAPSPQVRLILTITGMDEVFQDDSAVVSA
jgi:anti-anti-sigma factor